MSQRVGRVALVLMLVAGAAASGHQAVTRARAATDAERQLATLTAAHARADIALAELAAAQRAYVAPGQGIDFWTAKVDEALASARTALGALEAPAALSRLDDFSAMDQRARDYVERGQRSSAADTIFADGYEILAAARTEAATAVSATRATLTASAARNSQFHLAALSGLGACALIAALLLLRSPRTAEPVVSAIEPVTLVLPASQADVSEDSIGAALDASLEGLSAAPSHPAEPLMVPEPPASVDLGSAADVCVDLARLLDARDLQSVLARIADVLGANGLIVWIADPIAQALTPALTHGYPASLLARLGPLSIDEDTATSAAWRSRATQIVGGALAVPMLTSDGCTGVLAVEIRNGRERASDVQSLARILAAQLATTVSTPAPEARRAAEA